MTHAHADYVDAGADVVITASYQVSRRGSSGGPRPSRCGRGAACEHRGSAGRSPRSTASASVRVAASVGPYGAILHDGSEYRGNYGLTRPQLADFHRERLDVLADDRPRPARHRDDPRRARGRGAGRRAGRRPDLPAWMSFSAVDEAHVCAGQPIEEAVRSPRRLPRSSRSASTARTRASSRASSRGSAAVPTCRSSSTRMPAATWDADRRRVARRRRVRRRARRSRAALVGQWLRAGAAAIGGCCGTDAEDDQADRAQCWLDQQADRRARPAASCTSTCPGPPAAPRSRSTVRGSTSTSRLLDRQAVDARSASWRRCSFVLPARPRQHEVAAQAGSAGGPASLVSHVLSRVDRGESGQPASRAAEGAGPQDGRIRLEQPGADGSRRTGRWPRVRVEHLGAAVGEDHGPPAASDDRPRVEGALDDRAVDAGPLGVPAGRRAGTPGPPWPPRAGGGWPRRRTTAATSARDRARAGRARWPARGARRDPAGPGRRRRRRWGRGRRAAAREDAGSVASAQHDVRAGGVVGAGRRRGRVALDGDDVQAASTKARGVEPESPGEVEHPRRPGRAEQLRARRAATSGRVACSRPSRVSSRSAASMP